MTTACLTILAALVLLGLGGECLVRGAASLAVRLGLTPMVAGLTVVAFGTSTPELVASLQAVVAGKGDIAVGNAIGSNCFNVGAILGITALVRPLRAGLQLLKFDAPIMLGVVALPVWLLWDRTVSQVEAGILLALLVAYLVVIVRLARQAKPPPDIVHQFSEAVVVKKGSARLEFVFIVAGLALLVFGSHSLIMGSIAVARHFGVSEALIGLTIVAAGTAMPELAASLIAAFRRQPDIALGNIIGSNIFNILAILGTCGVVRPVFAPGIGMVDVAVMIAFAAALVPMMRSGMTLDRWEGFSLLAGYGVYLWWLWPR